MSNIRTLAGEVAVGITVAGVIALATYSHTIDTDITTLKIQQEEDARINAVVYTLQEDVTKSTTLLEVIVKNQDKIIDDIQHNRQLYLRRPEYAYKNQ